MKIVQFLILSCIALYWLSSLLHGIHRFFETSAEVSNVEHFDTRFAVPKVQTVLRPKCPVVNRSLTLWKEPAIF